MVNDYDKFAAHRQDELKRGEKKPHRFVEKPAMRKLLPNLANKEVLMLGCGTGEESILLEEYGATSMRGVDLSAESVRLANETYPKHSFSVADMHKLDFEDSLFDFVYSSLTVHYSANPIDVYKEVWRVLKPGGTFQFSIGHPMRWASERVVIDNIPHKLMGYTEGDTKTRLFGNYSDFQEYDETFPSGEVLRFWVGPPSLHFGLLREASFDVNNFVETKAVEECREVDENYFERFSHFPQFVVFVAVKPEQ
jgi:ubiquinone/menaquinone biosynthesis C-methylase UbiE